MCASVDAFFNCYTFARHMHKNYIKQLKYRFYVKFMLTCNENNENLIFFFKTILALV